MAEPINIFSAACIVALSFTLRDILMDSAVKGTSKTQEKPTMNGNNAKGGVPPGPNIKFSICYG